MLQGKIAVLDFRYDHFQSFRQALDEEREFTVNVGDFIQSIAVRELLQHLGIDDANIVEINRDSLASYQGPSARLIMNGAFVAASFPIPEQIDPIFIGFSTSSAVVTAHRDYFVRHAPIGCRDTTTTRALQAHGIPAFTTGCLTLSLPTRSSSPACPKTLIVHGSGAGELPEALVQSVPKRLLDGAEVIFQRLPMRRLPLADSDASEARRQAEALLRRYRDDATLVITPLLHAASPCVAMGVPVVLARKDGGGRFSAMQKLIPVYTPERFDEIDWTPSAVDIRRVKHHVKGCLRALLDGGSGLSTHATALEKHFE